MEWTINFPSDPIFDLVASLAVIVAGLAKGGFVGFGALCMPILTLVMDPVKGAAMMLPILIVQDFVGVWSFRKTWDAALLKTMLPGAALGIFLGWLFAASVPISALEGLVGLIALVFGAQRLLGGEGGEAKPKRQYPNWVGTLWGTVAGFTSQIAHSGGPPYQVWALTRGLSRDMYSGTTLIFFAAVNLAKVPAYFALGQFTTENMALTALFMPLAIMTTVAGVWFVRHIDPKRFFLIVHLLLVAVGLELLRRAFF